MVCRHSISSPCRKRPMPPRLLSNASYGAILIASALVLQGCFGGGGGEGSSSEKEGENKEGAKEESEPNWGSMGGLDQNGGGMNSLGSAHNDTYCSNQVSRNSETFQSAIREKAPKYYPALVSAFTEDYVKYPFCLENRRFQVWKTQRALRKDPEVAKLAGDDFEVAVENRIQQTFRDHKGDYSNFCQKWANNNVQFQTAKIDGIAQVLSLTPEEVKEELEGFFDWETWWAFFEAMQTSGCMTKYVDMCAAPVKVARRHALEKVREATGDPKMRWLYYPDNPHDVLGIASSSLVQTRTRLRHKESTVPMELRPTGHMLLRH